MEAWRYPLIGEFLNPKLRLEHSSVYLITDGYQCGPGALQKLIARAIVAGVDIIQIREKHLPAKQQFSLAEKIVYRACESETLVLINERFDIALSCHAHGVHLPADALPANLVRQITNRRLIVGVSTHSISEAKMAEEQGADYILFGPVFRTATKLKYGPPVGIPALKEVASKSRVPVFAVGGINLSNFQSVLDSGAQGIAAISLFRQSKNLKRDILAIKNYVR